MTMPGDALNHLCQKEHCYLKINKIKLKKQKVNSLIKEALLLFKLYSVIKNYIIIMISNSSSKILLKI